LKKFLVFFVLIFFSFFGDTVRADSGETTYFEGKVVEVTDEDWNDNSRMQTLRVKALEGEFVGQIITVRNEGMAVVRVNRYETDDRIYVSYSKSLEGENVFYIIGYARERGLMLLALIFIVIAVLIASKHGVWSLIAMALTFIILFDITLKYIYNGIDPVLVSVLSAIFIIPITFYMSHGFKKKVTVAMIGTFIALLITIALAVLFIDVTYLNGVVSEEALLLSSIGGVNYDLRGLLLAGIIIGSLGVLDDVTVGQAGIVFQIYSMNKKLSFWELYKLSIQFGKDHIASMINTLVLVYAGASMPLMLLFIESQRSFTGVISYESIATEIVRTLVGSIGLMVSVPITTVIACRFAMNE
jgi:uncharacterized membrane protein